MSKSYSAICADCGGPRSPRSKPRRGVARCRACSTRERWREQEFPYNSDAVSRSNRARLSPTTVRNLTAEEAAWLGAMIEADGSVYVGISRKGYPEVYVRVYNSNVETIATCLRLSGDGRVFYRGRRLSSKWPTAGTKPQWFWELRTKLGVLKFLPQIASYLTGKRSRARSGIALLRGMAGASCHPTHWESGPLPGKTEEEIGRAWEQFRAEDRIDPRSIRRQHRWKTGHEIDYAEPESGWVYQKIELESVTDPDQRAELTGGPESGVPCYRCNAITTVCGSRSMWEIYTQPGVEVVNLADIDESRKKELEDMRVVILVCTECKLKTQWLEEFLPKRMGHD